MANNKTEAGHNQTSELEHLKRRIQEMEAREAELLQNEARYRFLFENTFSSIAIHRTIDCGREFIITEFNDAAEKLTGAPREKVLGKNFIEVFPHLENSGVVEIFRRVYDTGEPEHFPLVVIPDSSRKYWIEEYVYKLPTGEIIAMFEDQTVRMQSQEQLRLSEERLQLAMQVTSDGLWDWDIPSEHVHYNPRYFTMLGYDPGEFAPTIHSAIELFHPDDAERVSRRIDALLERGEPYHVEFRLRNKAGNWQWILGRGDIVERDAQGNPLRMIGTHVDIHERKIMTRNLQRHVEELETLNILSKSVAMDISLEHVVSSSLDMIQQTLDLDLVMVYLVEGQELRLKGMRSNLQETDSLSKARHTVGQCMCGLAAQSSGPLFSLDIRLDARCTRTDCKNSGIHSFASIPLRNRERILGVLGMGTTTERDFSNRSDFMQSIAAIISMAVANALLHEEVLAHSEQLEDTVEKRTMALKKFQNAVETASATILITDNQGNIEYVNPRFCKTSGYSEDEVMGKNPRLLKSGVHDEEFYRRIWDTLLLRKQWIGEICNKTKNGDLYWEAATITPLLDKHGGILNFVAVKDDITKRKRAENRLRESEQRYKTVFNASRDGILIADLETRRLLHANNSMTSILGYLPGELLSLKVQDLIPHKDLEQTMELFEQQGLGLQDSAEKVRLVRKDGSEIYCDVTAIPVIIDERYCLIGFFRDMTELMETQKLREDVERITRHDLKSPLNGIIGLPEILLADDNLTDEQREHLQHIMDSGRKMLGIINLSLTLYQIENGKYAYVQSAFDILQIIRQCMRDNRPLSKEKLLQIRLRFSGFNEPEPGRVFINGEELLAYSVFSNLLINAVEASPMGEPVEIHLNNEPEQLEVIIHNSGVVPQDIRDTFFDKYTTQGKTKGTGLGTYSARMMAETQGWSIRMETGEKHGTFLTVSIPT